MSGRLALTRKNDCADVGPPVEEVDPRRLLERHQPARCRQDQPPDHHGGRRLSRPLNARAIRLQTETVVSPRLDDDTIGGLVLTTRDVTERKELEAADAEQERVRDMFSRFVPEAVVDELLAKGGAGLRLGGETLHGTIMFTDLRDFTSFSEARPAQEVIAVINQFLSEQTETIMAHGGTIIAYLGDGIMAAFGAPIAETTLTGFVRPPDDLVNVGDTAIRGRQAVAKLWSLESISDPA